ncbi:hypothetical protein Tco_0521820 [Tanacetum coccineum]
MADKLHEQDLFYYYDAFSPAVEPKSINFIKMLDSACWIEAMQEELNKFELLKVWELVPRPNKFMVITLKWIYKVKLDELGAESTSLWFQLDPAFVLMQRRQGNTSVYKYLSMISILLHTTPELYFSKSKGIFINQSKYALESLKNNGFDSCDPVDTPMVEKSKLDEDKEGKAIESGHIYRWCDMHPLYLIARTVNRGLWYPKDSSIALTTFADADHAGC